MARSKEDRKRGWRDFPVHLWESRSDHIWELLSFRPRRGRSQSSQVTCPLGLQISKLPTLTPAHTLRGFWPHSHA